MSARALVCAGLLASFGVGAADVDRLVIARAGTLPILLTAPHGGLEPIPGAAERTRGIRGTDAHTLQIALALEEQLGEELGGRPYVVAARFHRKYLDANRAPQEAFESPAAQAVYEVYHGHVRAYIAQMKERFPGGALLLDVHGQAEEPQVILRGTRDGATVKALLSAHGEGALSGPQSLFGGLQAAGFTVFPAGTPLGQPREDRRFNGGYTVHTYGSGQGGIDAIQIEYGRDVRRDPRVVRATSAGLVAFCRAYLGQCPVRR
jgi:N-formylglutamate amidohydrolase